MDKEKLTTRQIILFTTVLSFVVSVVGTMAVFSLFLRSSSDASGIRFNPFERIRNTIGQATSNSNSDSGVLGRQEDQVVKVVAETSPAVVSIVATKDVPVVERYYVSPFTDDPFLRQFFGQEFEVPQYRQRGSEKQEISSGTGFFVSLDGMIVTNKHVVADTEAEYTVFMNDGKKHTARILARDSLQDLAVLKIEGSGFSALPLGDSSQVKIGQTAIAIGNALGEFRNTVSVGVISGLHRSVVAQGSGDSGSETLQELIQTDAAINPGNSGGPLLNLRGEVIGIDTAMAQGAENIGFAIPVNNAKRALESIRIRGRIVYPFLGVRYILVTRDIAEKEKLDRDYGARIVGTQTDPGVVPDGPADKAGAQEGDIILQINGERIDENRSLGSIIQNAKVGDQVTLKIFRSGKEIELRATLEERK